MATEDTSEKSQLLSELEALVTEDKKVVSYKWFSRNYFISSNSAKQLLSDFVELKGGLASTRGVEAVYILSGWRKAGENGENPLFNKQVVQLVDGARLEAAKSELDSVASVHVYSVQARLPKDIAGLWTADYIQSEQLFNEPKEVANCLRDNRFSGISCPLVKRDASFKRRQVATTTPQKSETVAKPSLGVDPSSNRDKAPPQWASDAGNIETNVKLCVAPISGTGEASRKDASANEDAQQGCLAQERKAAAPLPGSKGMQAGAPVVTASAEAAVGSKRKGGAAGGGGGNSLASLWNRAAATKPKVFELAEASKPGPPATMPAEPDNSNGNLGLEGPHLRVIEDQKRGQVLDDEDDDDDMIMLMRRRGPVQEVAGTSRRRRRMVVDDEDEDEEAVGDDKAPVAVAVGVPDAGDQLNKESMQVDTKPASSQAVQHKSADSLAESGVAKAEGDKGARDLPPRKVPSTADTAELPPPKKKLALEASQQLNVVKAVEGPQPPSTMTRGPSAAAAATGPGSKRKEMRTRIDDKGRETFFYVWVDENGQEIPEPAVKPLEEAGMKLPSSDLGEAKQSITMLPSSRASNGAAAADRTPETSATAAAAATKGQAHQKQTVPSGGHSGGGKAAGGGKGPASGKAGASKVQDKKKGPQQGNLLSFFGKKS